MPFLAVCGGAVLAWQSFLHWSDLVVFAILYPITGLGITVGFHRLLTHRAFKTKNWVTAMFAIFGSAAIEGPVIAWVADHRKHHAFADMEGDPHSPHVDHGDGWKGAVKGLLHAHVGWLFLHTQRGKKDRYAPDLIADPTIRFVDRTFVLWVVARAGDPVPARDGARRLGHHGADGDAVGRAGPRVPAPPRDLLDQLAVPLLRAPALRHRRRVAQPAVARAAVVRRVVAQQPPRVPDVGAPRDEARGSSTSPPA